jgi:hypothetical protein
MTELWSGGRCVCGCEEWGPWVCRRICGVTACLLHALGSPPRSIVFLPFVLACPCCLTIHMRHWLVSTHCGAAWGFCVGLGHVLDRLHGIVTLCRLGVFVLAVVCLLHVLTCQHCLAIRALCGIVGAHGFTCIGRVSSSCWVLAGPFCDLVHFHHVFAGLSRHLLLPLPHFRLLALCLSHHFPCLAVSCLRRLAVLHRDIFSPCHGVASRCVLL